MARFFLPTIGLACAAIAFGGFPAVAFATNGLEPIGVSTQSRGRGGADVAVGDSALSQVDNPATLSLHPCGRCDFSGMLLMPDYYWTGPAPDSAHSEIAVIPLINIGKAIPVSDRLTWGWALHSKSGIAARFHALHQDIPGPALDDQSDYLNASLPLNVSYRLTDQLSIGGGVRAEAATAKFRTVLGDDYLNFDRGFAFGGGFQAGLFYQAAETLTFGLAYRSPTWFGDLQGGGAQIVSEANLGDAEISNFHLPQKIIAGAAWDAACWLRLVGEVRWINWSESSFHSAVVNTDVTGPIPFPLGYRDQWVYVAGADIRLDEHWKLSLGYNYGTAPISTSNLLPIVDAFVKHHVTAGLIYEQDNWWIGGGYILGVRTALDGSGDSQLPEPNDFANSRLEQTLHSLFFGYGFNW